MKTHLTGRFLGIAALAILPCADAQVPAGGDFLINTYTTGAQEPLWPRRAVAAAPGGDFVAVWTSFDQDGSTAGIFGQRYDAAGVPRGSEFLVNTYTTGAQLAPTIAVGYRGDFVVVWQSAGQDGDGDGIFAQRYDAAGARAGGEFLVNTHTALDQGQPAAAVDVAGSFVVVWSSGADLSAQRFDAAGNRRGVEFLVNEAVNDGGMPSVGMDGESNFVVVWSGRAGQTGTIPLGRRFDAQGAARGPVFELVELSRGHEPRVSVGPRGDFVATWGGGGGFGELDGIFARRFDASGAPLGPDFHVNTYTTGTQYRPDVAVDGSGNFTVVWTNGQTSTANIIARRYDSSGIPRSAEFQVNTTAFGLYPSLASDNSGNLTVTWAGPDPSLLGVFGKRFGGLQPAALSVDASPSGSSNGNGIFEAGESVVVAPSWRNVNGAAQTFTGSASALTGPGAPGDPIYLIKNSSADYGTVPNGGTASCAATGDCYLVATTVPSTRPVRHWDASLREDILPVAHGQSRTWTLHVGDSFTDVLRSSGFYRFIETLMHGGVTAGCGPTQYCPGGATARQQMAVFVLVAREGAGYVPPACGATPMFADVPATNPSCRWIEELARRGVVGGCGGGNYCPTAPVSREQMSVFVLLTLDPTLNPTPCAPPNVYNDVPETNPFCRWIEELTSRGVVTGCGGGNYCPTAAVTREQMGVFISVTFGLTLYGP